MIETFYGIDRLDTRVAFFTALAVGVAFGFVLERAGFGSARRIAGVFYFTDMTVVKVMFAGMLTAMIGLVMLEGVGWLPSEQTHALPSVYGAQAVGGLLFGIGFVMSGWCPGTSAVGVASGKLDAFVFLGGITLGALLFNEVFSWVQPLYSWGFSPEAPVAFGVPVALFATAFALTGVGAFYASEWVETKAGEGQLLRTPFLKAFCLALVAAAAALFVLPTDRVAAASHRPFRQSERLESIATGDDHIAPEALADQLMTADPELLLIDIRPEAEYRRFHLRGAVSMPMDSLVESLHGRPSLETIVLYSNGMTHPAQAREILVSNGYTNTYLLTDGLQGFIDHCLRPRSLRDYAVADQQAKQIDRWREYFLTEDGDNSLPDRKRRGSTQ